MTVMQLVAQVILLLIHAIYGLKNFLFSFIPLRKPKPLLVRRKKVPAHLALLLVPDLENHDARIEESVMEECVEQVVVWCKQVGIPRLSVYERDGVLSNKSIYTSPSLTQMSLEVSDNVLAKASLHPLTPPSSDTDSSRPRSPMFEKHMSTPAVTTIRLPYVSRDGIATGENNSQRRQRHSRIFESKARLETLTLHVLSRQSSKPLLAAAARSLATMHGRDSRSGPTTDILGNILEGETGFPPPDLIIVFPLYPTTIPLEMYGFPPWQLRLTEIHYTPRRGGVLRQILRFLIPSRRRNSMALAITEIEFRRALDEYAGAEMRLGK